MAEDEERPLSTVVPHLVAAIVCDVAVADPTTNKKSLIGVFDRLSVGKFPAKRPVSLYFKITDAEGNYDLDIRYVQSDTGKVLAKVQAQGGLKVKDRLSSVDFHFSLPPLPFPAAGRYEFQIWTNSSFLGSTSITAVQGRTEK